MAGVRTVHPDYEAFAPKWKRVRDVVAGQDAMHNAGEAYLPRLKDELETAYKARVRRADFFNGTWITVRAFTGMLFRKSPAKDIPAGIETYLTDVTMTGKTDEAFAKGLIHEALAITRFGILIDHPSRPDNVKPITQAAAQALRLRPKLAMYAAESIINWTPQEPGKPGQYAMVVLAETAAIGEDRYSHKTEPRYRVLDLDGAGFYRQQVWRINAKDEDEQVGGDIYPVINGQKLTEIPFRTYGADGEDTELDDPALIDLVNANVAVYEINADYRHGLHFTALPTPYVCGYSPPGTGADGSGPPEKLYIGSQSAWVFTEPNAKVGFLEFTGQGLTEVREAIGAKKQEMAMAGARAIMDETDQVETLGATQIKRNGENSALSNVAITVSAALEWALGFFAKWAGSDGKVEYQLNRDFIPTGIDAQTLTALVAANQAGKLSDEELFDLFQRNDLIDGDKQFEAHQEQVKSQAGPVPPTVRPVIPPGAAGAAAA